MTETELTLKRNLKQLRELYGFSKRKFASAIGIDLSYYNRLENPERNVVPRFTTLEKICNFYQIPVSRLFEHKIQDSK